MQLIWSHSSMSFLKCILDSITNCVHLCHRSQLRVKAELARQGESAESVKEWLAANNRFKSALNKHYTELQTHMPNLSPIVKPTEDLHMAKLYLPSDLSSTEQQEHVNFVKLAKIEMSLRIPMAQSEILRLRNALGVKAFLIREGRQTGKSGKSGYTVLTRTQGRVGQSQVRINAIAERYRRQYSALQSLGAEFGIGTLAGELRPLLPSDLEIITTWTQHEIQYNQAVKRPTVGKSISPVPWIWKCFGPGLVGKEDDEDEVNTKIAEFNHQGMPACLILFYLLTLISIFLFKYYAAMRLEWLVTKAQLTRWEEEEKLLREESRRIVVYFEWKARELALHRDRTQNDAFRCWLEQKRRMWCGMADRARRVRLATEDKLTAEENQYTRDLESVDS